jgi:hypothetical protein
MVADLPERCGCGLPYLSDAPGCSPNSAFYVSFGMAYVVYQYT